MEVCPVPGDLDLLLLHLVVRSDCRSLQAGLGLRPTHSPHLALLHLVDGDEPVDVVPRLHHLVVPVDPRAGRAEDPDHLRVLVSALVPVAQSYRVRRLLHRLGARSEGGRRHGGGLDWRGAGWEISSSLII